MAVMIKEPEISERFDLDDIRRIREYSQIPRRKQRGIKFETPQGAGY